MSTLPIPVMSPAAELLTKRMVTTRYNVTERTLWNWQHKLDGFPKPLKIGGRWFWRLSDLLAFEGRAVHA